jgi:hypothetical protein
MRQVDRDELINRIQAAIRGWPKSILRGLADHRPTEQLRARLLGATMISDKLSKLEILSDSPPPPPIRYADLEGVSGVPAQDDIKPNGPMR